MTSKITAHEVKYPKERKLEAMLPPSFKLNTSTGCLVAKHQLCVVCAFAVRCPNTEAHPSVTFTSSTRYVLDRGPNPFRSCSKRLWAEPRLKVFAPESDNRGKCRSIFLHLG